MNLWRSVGKRRSGHALLRARRARWEPQAGGQRIRYRRSGEITWSDTRPDTPVVLPRCGRRRWYCLQQYDSVRAGSPASPTPRSIVRRCRPTRREPASRSGCPALRRLRKRPTIAFWFDLASNYSPPVPCIEEAQRARVTCAGSPAPPRADLRGFGWASSPFVHRARGAYVWRTWSGGAGGTGCRGGSRRSLEHRPAHPGGAHGADARGGRLVGR